MIDPIPDVQARPLLVVENVSKAFDGSRRVRALQSISFTMERGEIVCLVGPSGSGKSTLLRIVGGLTQADTGRVELEGALIREPHPAVGMVFQRTNLMPWRTLLENVLLPVEVEQGSVSAATREQALAILRLVGLEGFEQHYPRQLSGGMAQRAVLARTLLQAPRLSLLDEPFGALDALTRERMNVELLRLQEMHKQTILMVTHSISEAVFLADRVLVLSARPGRLVAEVAIDLPRPRELFIMGTAAFAQLTQVVRSKIDLGEKLGTDTKVDVKVNSL